MMRTSHCYSWASHLLQVQVKLTSIQIRQLGFIAANLNSECEKRVWLMHNVLHHFGQSLLFLSQVWFPAQTMCLLLLDMQSQNGLPTLELALPHTEKERDGGKKGPLMKGLNPAPHSHSSPPSLFPPCPVELIWQRGGSISQFTQAAAFFFFFFLYCAFFHLPCLCLHPHPPLCSLCVCLFAHVCVHSVCYSACTGRWNIKYSKVEDGPTPEAGNTCLVQAVQLRCHGTGITTYLRPSSCAAIYCAVCRLCFSLLVSVTIW